MSARMISLAINIALMGFVLVEGVQSSLRAALPGDVDGLQLRSLAERIAAGTGVGPDQGVSAAMVHQALTQGFGWIMLYGGIGVWLLAAASTLVFGPGPDENAGTESDFRSLPVEK
jgi:hypothetical protein